MPEPYETAEPPANKRLEYLKLWVERRIARSHVVRAKSADALRMSSELHQEWQRWREGQK